MTQTNMNKETQAKIGRMIKVGIRLFGLGVMVGLAALIYWLGFSGESASGGSVAASLLLSWLLWGCFLVVAVPVVVCLFVLGMFWWSGQVHLHPGKNQTLPDDKDKPQS